MMDRATELASDHGIGLVALRNANHWMRGRELRLASRREGYIGICWTNSIAVMPAWGSKECCIGTNPLIVAILLPNHHGRYVDVDVLLRHAGSEPTGRTHVTGRRRIRRRGQSDQEHGVIEKNRRILPMGYWKVPAYRLCST